jgi:tetratricopeptide (TPR) repeat protein
VEIFKQSDDQARHKSNLQNAYKVLGDIYFTKNLNTNESRSDDFENAHKYYKLEREIIDTMTLDDIVDPEEGDLEKLKQSSHFNMGVMESKSPTWYSAAEANLKEAITIAHQLKDFASEKTAWWELGNLYKRVGQFDNVKYCQRKELRLIRIHKFKDDEIYCFEERCKDIRKLDGRG